MNAIEKIENKQCRTCYNSTKGLRFLTNLTKCGGTQEPKSYAELLKEVANINILENLYNEQLPKSICESCARRLKASYTFILQCQEVNERLIAVVSGVEANKELKCLQEPAVDILPVAGIKAEKDDEDMDFLGHLEPECFVELKIEDAEEKLKAEDVLSIGKDEVPAIEVLRLPTCSISSSKESFTDSKNENFTKDGKETNEFSNDDDDEGDDDSPSASDAEWKYEETLDKTEGSKKKKSPRSKKGSHNIDDDIAVPCTECNKIFNNSKALTRHQRNTHIPEEQKCTCTLCGRRFSRTCNMYKHMRTFHGPDSVPLIRKPSTKERLFQCDKCERNYTKKCHLNLHIKEKHSNEQAGSEKDSQSNLNSDQDPNEGETQKKDKPKKRYEVRSLCSICGSSFASRTHLVVHMRRHTGERPFKCDLCERAYPRLSELVCHRRIHTGEKPFKCKICDKAFRVWSKMSNHMRSHTDIRPYKCTQCERSFKYSKDLNIHFRIHTGERPYKCNVCGSTFTQSNTLKAHRSKLGHMDEIIVAKENIV